VKDYILYVLGKLQRLTIAMFDPRWFFSSVCYIY